MSGMFPVASFPCICYRTEDYHCVSVSRLFSSPLSQSIFVYEWPRLSVALTGHLVDPEVGCLVALRGGGAPGAPGGGPPGGPKGGLSRGPGGW